jgi:hypothetical protein
LCAAEEGPKSAAVDATQPVTGNAPTVRLRIAGAAGFEQEKEVPVREAVLYDTLGIFIGKTGAVRGRSGFVKTIVVLSSQEVGCGRVREAPAVFVLGQKRAEAMQKRLATTAPQITEPATKFEPKGDADFEVSAVSGFLFDPKGIERDPSTRPLFYQLLEGKELLPSPPDLKGADRKVGDHIMTSELSFKEFTLSISHRSLPPKYKAHTFYTHGPDKPPFFALLPKNGEWRLKLDAEDKALAVHADLPLRKCPAVENIHIEPK